MGELHWEVTIRQLPSDFKTFKRVKMMFGFVEEHERWALRRRRGSVQKSIATNDEYENEFECIPRARPWTASRILHLHRALVVQQVLQERRTPVFRWLWDPWVLSGR